MQFAIFFGCLAMLQWSVTPAAGAGISTTSMQTCLKSRYLTNSDKKWLKTQDVATLQVFEKQLQAKLADEKLEGERGNLPFLDKLTAYLRYRRISYIAQHETLPQDICSQVLEAIRLLPFFAKQPEMMKNASGCLKLEAGNMGRGIWITPLPAGLPGANFVDAWKHFRKGLREGSLLQTLELVVERHRLCLFYMTLERELRERGISVEHTADAELVKMQKSGELLRELTSEEGRRNVVARMHGSLVNEDPDDVLRPKIPEPPEGLSSGIKTSVGIFVVLYCTFGSVLLANGLTGRDR